MYYPTKIQTKALEFAKQKQFNQVNSQEPISPCSSEKQP